MWIFGSAAKDCLYLVLPPLVVWWLVQDIEVGSDQAFLIALVSLAIIDNGHVFLTLFRTYFDRKERQRRPRYLWTPIFVLIGLTLWYYAHLPYFWNMIVYATFWHNIRQFFGFNRWYQKIEKRSCRLSNFFIHALTLTPIVLFHFRPDARAQIYSTNDLLLYPDPSLYQAGLYILGSIIVAWILFELFNFRRLGKFEFGRFLSIFVPGFLYITGFTMGKNFLQVIAPIATAHGVAYLAAISLSMNRTNRTRFTSFVPTIFAMSLFTILFGLGLSFLSESWGPSGVINYKIHQPGLGMSFIIACLFTPALSHYIIDGFIWSRDHPDSSQIYSPET